MKRLVRSGAARARRGGSLVLRGVKLAPLLVTNPQRLRRLVRDSEFRRRLDPRVDGWQQQIDQAYAAGDARRVIDLVTNVLRISGVMDTPDVRIKLISSYAELGHFEAIDDQLVKALERHPESAPLWRVRAERAMMLHAYDQALRFWQMEATHAHRSDGANLSATPFPLRGTTFDWYEMDWMACARRWEELWASSGGTPTLIMYQRVAQTMLALGEFALARAIAARGAQAYSGDRLLVLELCEAIVGQSPAVGARALADEVAALSESRAAAELAEEIVRGETVIDDVRSMGRCKPNELRVLTAYRHSGVEFAVRAGDFWGERRIHARAMELAKRDRWPEQFSETDLVSEGAWREAKKFAEPRAKLVGASVPALSRAVFHYFKQELIQKLPVDRIADDLVRAGGKDPVFIDLGPAKIPYLAGYPGGRMQTMYFYHALRKRGANVVLVRFPRRPAVPRTRKERKRPPLTSMPTLVLAPQPAQLLPPDRPLRATQGNPGDVLVPAGIRSVKAVLSRIGNAIVFNSGSAVKGFAYDRSVRQDWDYPVNVSIHAPDSKLLPIFRLKTSIVRTWRSRKDGISGSALAPSSNEPVEAFLSAGTWDTRDWHSWLERAIVPYFRDLVRRARTILDSEAVMDAHIGDYLYAESELVASKVKDRGGRVHLWPHSTNPVHVEFHDPSHIESVHAVTKSGAELWRRAAPKATVIHDSALMLQQPRIDVDYTAGQPLSVVVIGGRPVMRHLPILDIEAHEALYQKFFTGMQGLVDRGDIKVYFKPRGKTGEHELWLEELVGRAGNWERVLEHPLRMTLPNPVFVSLSVGSSALLEGVTRGIPGMIVKEGFARDYLATDGEIFEAVSANVALARLEEACGLSEWSAWRSEQMGALDQELSH